MSTHFGGDMTSTHHMPPGWYPDQQDRLQQRYWDGQSWTGHARPAHPTPIAGGDTTAASASLRARWKSLRVRTQVGIVVFAVLVLFVAFGSNDDATPEDTTTTPVDTSSEERDTEPAPEQDEADPEPEPELTVVPKLMSMEVDDARSKLRRADLAVRIVMQPSWKTAGVVLAQRTSAGTKVSPGRIITLVVAAPMPLIPVLAGRSEADDVAALRRAGFTVRVVKEVVTSGSSGVILRLVPAGGTRAAPGAEVQVVVSNLVRPVVAPPAPSNCTSGYSPCLAPAPDYDCAGGSGDGPKYTGLVHVTGSDPYGLDADGDGVACE